MIGFMRLDSHIGTSRLRDIRGYPDIGPTMSVPGVRLLSKNLLPLGGELLKPEGKSYALERERALRSAE